MSSLVALCALVAIMIVCGSILSDSTGVFTSPNYPGNYPNESECIWIISFPAGHRIVINVTDFHMEFDTNCNHDYLEIRNGGFRLAPLVGKYCGTKIDHIIRSHSNTMWFKFKTDASNSSTGFSISYDVTPSVCGARLTDLTGVFTSPNFPGNYDNKRECIWIIEVPAGYQILINVTDFHVEFDTSCRYDYLEIRNGGSRLAPLVGKYCGTKIDHIIHSHSNTMWFKFKTDFLSSNTGFSISYNGTSLGCGADLTTPNGSFISPLYPLNYGNNAECLWTITVSRGSTITIRFLYFDMETHDYLQIREGGPQGNQLALIYGKQVPSPIHSKTNKLWIKFSSDSTNTGRGFQAFYSTSCNNRLTSFSGVIESPNFPKAYPHNLNCTWIIDTPFNSTVNVSFSHFDIESQSSCSDDRLQVRNGDSVSSNLIKNMCGRTIPDLIASTGDKLWFNFKSDSLFGGNGFRLEWTAGCGADLTTPSGSFISPLYPLKYSLNTECFWTITVWRGSTIIIRFVDFNLETHESCGFDYLQIREGGPQGYLLAFKCGSQVPRTIHSTTNNLWIKFSSDLSVTGRGFKAFYSTICGDRLTDLTGVFTSPNYPGNYPNESECIWIISVPAGHHIVINVTDFHMEFDTNCNHDYLEIRKFSDGYVSSPFLGKHCGSSLNNVIIPFRSNTMWLKFKTDASYSFTGFSISYDVTPSECGADLTTHSGSFISPLYPRNYGNNAECFWTITVSRGSTITIRFLDFDMETHDYLQIRDGGYYGNQLALIYGKQVPSPIHSKTNKLWIKFSSDSTIAGRGFQAFYSTSCNNRLTSVSGVIESPNFPKAYPNNLDCTWIIDTPLGRTLNVSFSHFDIASRSSCLGERLQVRNGDSVSSNLIKNMCGHTIPDPIASTGDKLWFNFKSDSLFGGNGFRLEWITAACGADLTTLNGSFISPFFPLNYGNNTECLWTITVSRGMTITISFVNFDIEYTSSCGYDYLEIRDGGPQGNLLAFMCGSQVPSPIHSTTNKLWIKFSSDYIIAGRGFQAFYSTICGARLTDLTGVFTSPNYPGNYPNERECIWIINVPAGNWIIIHITDFHMEFDTSCDHDYLEIRNGGFLSSQLFGKYCGTSMNNFIIPFHSNTMWFKFKTDASYSFTGFSISYDVTQSGCGADLTAPTGSFFPQSYPPKYYSYTGCYWTITVSRGMTITISFVDFDEETHELCHNDYLQIRDGGPQGNQLALICENQVPIRIHSKTNKLWIKFRSDASVARRGFQAFYFTSESSN